MKKLFVYIAGPYTKGDAVLNVRNAINASEKVVELGHVPFVPHLYHFWHFYSPKPYQYWTKLDNEWIAKCDAIIRLPGESSGSDAEVELAKQQGIPCFTLY